ncbi:icarapin-like [Microplitis mediator]|uniref:icarapin-like n=1 Tax=Microplitis mediator TaxID=375433 RepID=UPI002555CD6F|nr:icarapin-like [Microplitis mediator]
MKSILVIFLLLLASAHCYPGVPRDPGASEANDKQKSQIELILPEEDRKNFGQLPNFDDDDDDEGFRFTPIKFNLRPIQSDEFFRPLTPFFSGVQDMMKQMREEMAKMFTGFPTIDDFKPLVPIPKDAVNKTSSKSETKIINGNKVTINETTYTDGTNNSNTIVRFRVIHVRPENETSVEAENNSSPEVVDLETEVDTEPKGSSKEESTNKSVEAVEDWKNDIPDSPVDDLKA